MWRSWSLTVAFVLGCAWLDVVPAQAQDLVWEVLNPVRLYRNDNAFRLHQDAFKAIGGDREGADRTQTVRLIERCINDPASLDQPMRDACLKVAHDHHVDAYLGWAAATLGETCYNDKARPRVYWAQCDRDRAGRKVSEDYILPAAHAVSIGLAPARLAEAGTASCTWSYRPRAGGDWIRVAPQPCAQSKILDNVPFARDRAASGLQVKVELPDGHAYAADVVVDDLLIVALGDSFASGEGNPDKPVKFSATRGMQYDDTLCRATTSWLSGFVSSALRGSTQGLFGVREIVGLPRRLMSDEERRNSIQFEYCSPEFFSAFWEKSPQWLSPDCHRSQYAFPFRVGMQLALEDRHRAVTLVELACSGAEVLTGLLQELDAREHYDNAANKTTQVPPQFDQLTKLLCSVSDRVDSEPYPLTAFKPGDKTPQHVEPTMRWCPPGKRKRDIDLVLLSIGGNDIGFSRLAAYTFLDSTVDIAPLLGFADKTYRFGTDVAYAYLKTLDARMHVVQRALDDGFGVKSSHVVQVSYEAVQFDESGKPCGQSGKEKLGMDVHPNFALNGTRLGEVSRFLGDFFAKLVCISNHGSDCKDKLVTGEGTKFTLVTDHQPEFLKRGVCAHDPHAAFRDYMDMPRIGPQGTFSAYDPSKFRPYAHRVRLFRTPNDGFMTGNVHRTEEATLFVTLQPAVAALLSGAFHPTAEAHSIVADYVMAQVRAVLVANGAAR